jgi:hypothetical protein
MRSLRASREVAARRRRRRREERAMEAQQSVKQGSPLPDCQVEL